MSQSARTIRREPATASPDRTKPASGNTATVASAPAPPQKAFYSSGPAMSLGNRVKTKLAVGSNADPHEREADAMADGVVAGRTVATVSRSSAGKNDGASCTGCRTVQRMPQPEPSGSHPQAPAPIEKGTLSAGGTEASVVRRALQPERAKPGPTTAQAQESMVTPTAAGTDSVVRRVSDEAVDEKPVHPQGSDYGGPEASSAMNSAAERAVGDCGPGERMKPQTRHILEARTGARLDHVRVHTDAQAHASADSLRAALRAWIAHLARPGRVSGRPSPDGPRDGPHPASRSDRRSPASRHGAAYTGSSGHATDGAGGGETSGREG